MNKISDNKELRDYTREVWQPYCDKPLTEQDCDEIKDNMTEFINLLLEMRETRNKMKDIADKT